MSYRFSRLGLFHQMISIASNLKLFTGVLILLGSSVAQAAAAEVRARDFVIPQEVWQKIVSLSEGKRVYFSQIAVQLTEKNKGVLRSSPQEFKLGLGGGDIDLFEIEGKNPGTYFVKFDLPKDALVVEVFYLSYGTQKQVEGVTAGAGCEKSLDLTEAVKSWNGLGEKQGFPVNSSFGIHAHALSGHWIFAIERPERRVEISKVTFFHSQHKDAACPGLI